MQTRIVSLCFLCTIFLSAGAAGVWGQDEDTPRGIFDSQTRQKPSPNTTVKPRVLTPKRPKIPEATPKVSTLGNDHKTALKYSVMVQGRETPNGYEVGRNLAKVEAAQDGKPYGLTDPQRNFKEGDIIYLLFEVSRPGYLYVVNLGSDGKTRTLIHPDPGKSSMVMPDAPLVIGPLRIDPPPGVDRLTVLFSKERIPSFEDPAKDLNQSFVQELNSRNYKTIEEEEVYLPAKETLALYFSNQGDLLKAEIDVKHGH